MRLVFILLFPVLISYSQNKTAFEIGIEQYREANYKEAISTWESIVNEGNHSTALYYNLGNAYFKSNQLGPSIFYFEKALQLTPGDKDVLNNLAFAQKATIDDITPLPQNFLVIWVNTWSKSLTLNQWAWVTVLSVLLFTVLFAAYFFSTTPIKKRILFSGALLFLFLGIFSYSIASSSYNKSLNNEEAIIFSESTQVRSEPLMRSEVSFILHEGTKVKITAQDTEWYKIELADGKEGWIVSKDIKRL